MSEENLTPALPDHLSQCQINSWEAARKFMISSLAPTESLGSLLTKPPPDKVTGNSTLNNRYDDFIKMDESNDTNKEPSIFNGDHGNPDQGKEHTNVSF